MRRPLLSLLFLAPLTLSGLTLYFAWPYYRLPLEARPWSHLHDLFGPSNAWGHWVGVIGSALLLACLLYLGRRAWSWPGAATAWLSFHVWSALGGMALIIPHSSFLAKNWVANTSMIALGVLLVTGLFGRWGFAWVAGVDDAVALPGEGRLLHQARGPLSPELRRLRRRARVKQAARLWKPLHRLATYIFLLSFVAHLAIVIFVGGVWLD
ncbi:hypothetical protein KKF91_02285 [Myxococcota bacterium]|nr:hypothetical protein [Myxococcota bacterium]MBU1429367.1 hypothetical protein [Myxococcota bacterium]MBU1899882.1 hypothetical protein [Myxococcota bacterium]